MSTKPKIDPVLVIIAVITTVAIAFLFYAAFHGYALMPS